MTLRFSTAAPARHKVVAYDCGVKRGILEGLVRAGCDLTVVPWDTPASEVLDMNPDGVFFVQWPRRPRRRGGDLRAGAAADRQGAGLWHLPGHQMISPPAAPRWKKLKFGHRGGNQPVMNPVSRRVEITAQNHGFGLLFPSPWASLSPSFPAARPSMRPMEICASGCAAESRRS